MLDNLQKLLRSILIPNELESRGEIRAESCKCAHLTCGCCASVSILGKHYSSCLNLRFIPKEIGLDVKFTFNDHTVFEKIISANHPPELCFPVVVANACFELYNLGITNGISGCAKVTFSALFIHLPLELGCFKIQLSDARSIRNAGILVNGMKEVQISSRKNTTSGLDDLMMDVMEDVFTARMKEIAKEIFIEAKKEEDEAKRMDNYYSLN